MPETSWRYHCWQPALRRRPHRWLAKPDNPAMSPLALDKTGTRHTDTHIMLLLPATRINMRYSPEHGEFHSCASVLNILTSRLQSLLVVYLGKLDSTR